MDCNSATLNGIQVGCKDNMGGIKAVYIALTSDVSLPYKNYTTTDEMITDMKGEQDSFTKYEFRKQTGGMTSTMTVDDTVGTQYWTTEVTLQFSKMETSKSLEINALCIADTYVIVQDSNNKFWFLGWDNPVSATAATAQAGTAYGDLNGYTITLSDMSKQLPYEVSPELMADM